MVVVGGSMSKVRVYEVAKQLNLDPKQVVTLFQSIGVTDVRNHMSSVEAEAVERLKRNLEKQKTHDVVEERIRRGAGTVLKRRAVAKAPAESTPVSVQPMSAAQPSSPVLDDIPSRRDISQLAIEAPPSQTAVAKAAPSTDVLAKDESTRILAYREVPEDRRSASEVAVPAVPPAPPSARPSSRTDIAVPPAPESRTSEPAIAAPASQTTLMPAVVQVPTPPPSAHAVAPAAEPEPPAPPVPGPGPGAGSGLRGSCRGRSGLAGPRIDRRGSARAARRPRKWPPPRVRRPRLRRRVCRRRRRPASSTGPVARASRCPRRSARSAPASAAAPPV